MTQRGTLLGARYELDQIIGRGGMAEVWRARDTRLARDVAIKRLRIDLASDPTFQARFRREAQSAAGLNHPNIVAVYDTGEELDPSSQVSVPYIVMELVDGVTLRDVLRDGRKVLPERALEFTAGVLDALDYSHRAGIIHRDIKPANVMLTPAGAVKVMDFGIARAVADTSATMTQTAAVIGTAQYLSPEQARGEKVDQRSDIYSVGCLLYELLTSEPPFKGDSPVSVAYQHVREAPRPPSLLDPEINADMDAVTLKALAKSTADRYQDAREMRADVLRAMNHQPVHAVIGAAGAEDATAVMSANTTTARRAAVPAAAPAAVAIQSPVDMLEEGDEEEEKTSKKGLVVLLVLAGLLLAGMLVAIFMILNPGETAAETVPVPAVTGETQISAENTLSNVSLVPEVKPVPGTEADKGKVLTQSPAAGESAEVGSTVVLEVSQGPDTKKIPDVTGMTEADARAVLETAGFTNVTAEDAKPADEPTTAKAGEVITTEPQAEGDVNPADEVKLVIATGKSVLPNLLGDAEQVAKEKAQTAGFDNVVVTTVETDEEQPGQVYLQDPPAGIVLRTQTITITIAEPLPEIEVTELTVPNLRGYTEEKARQELTAAGFTTPPEIKTVATDAEEPGNVFDQFPKAGTILSPAGPIQVMVAAAPVVTEEPATPTPTPTPTATATPSAPASITPTEEEG